MKLPRLILNAVPVRTVYTECWSVRLAQFAENVLTRPLAPLARSLPAPKSPGTVTLREAVCYLELHPIEQVRFAPLGRIVHASKVVCSYRNNPKTLLRTRVTPAAETSKQ